MKYTVLSAVMCATLCAMLQNVPNTQAATQAAAAGQEGHGGDSYSAEFTSVAERLLTEITARSTIEPLEVDPALLSRTIDNTLVESTDSTLSLEGRLVDAINYPDRALIVISRPSWVKMTLDQRRLLALHEYLSVSRVDDENYKVSVKVLLKLEDGAPYYTPGLPPGLPPLPTPSASATSIPWGSGGSWQIPGDNPGNTFPPMPPMPQPMPSGYPSPSPMPVPTWSPGPWPTMPPMPSPMPWPSMPPTP